MFLARPHPAAMPVLLGLAAAITWGAADFAGGLATRRAAPSRVVFIAHGTSLVLLAAVSLRMPALLSPFAILGGLLSGIAGGIALMVFYEALALGAMGLSAALAGLLTAILPVLLAIHTQGAPAPLQIAGFSLAAAAIVLIAYAPPASNTASPPPPGPAAGLPPVPPPAFVSAPAPRAKPSRRALLFATLAGVGFGLQLVWLHWSAAAGRPAPGGSTFAPVLRALMLSRLGGAAVALTALLAARARHRARLLPAASEPSAAWLLPLPVLAAIAGLLDTGGNGFYMLASLSGRLDIAAVLSSLYPGSTIALAAIFLRERATRLQALGMATALLAVALIAG